MNEQWPSLPGGGGLTRPGTKGTGKGLGKGKSAKMLERRARTVYFGDFPQDTKGATIKAEIDEIMMEFQDSIEETYAFGKHATRGAARFKSEELMWEFMVQLKGNHAH
eukprot:7789766-Karenia_brevis.AAC.1